MIFKTQIKLNVLIVNTLSNVFKISKPRRDFFIEIMLLFLSIKGRLNFLQFGRYGNFGEQRYRQQFEKQFDFLNFNKEITKTDCQARSKNKLHFQFNASLTAINLVKVEYWLSIPKNERAAFSMSDIKTMYHNALLLERFIKVFAVKPNKLKNNNNVKELINFGKIAA